LTISGLRPTGAHLRSIARSRQRTFYGPAMPHGDAGSRVDGRRDGPPECWCRWLRTRPFTASQPSHRRGASCTAARPTRGFGSRSSVRRIAAVAHQRNASRAQERAFEVWDEPLKVRRLTLHGRPSLALAPLHKPRADLRHISGPRVYFRGVLLRDLVAVAEHFGDEGAGISATSVCRAVMFAPCRLMPSVRSSLHDGPLVDVPRLGC
jgi:hypothetical protein